jgi:hypothetical protein
MRYAIFKDHKQWFVYDNHTKKILPTPYNTKSEARAAARSLEQAEERFERAVAFNARVIRAERAANCRRYVNVGSTP